MSGAPVFTLEQEARISELIHEALVGDRRPVATVLAWTTDRFESWPDVSPFGASAFEGRAWVADAEVDDDYWYAVVVHPRADTQAFRLVEHGSVDGVDSAARVEALFRRYPQLTGGFAADDLVEAGCAAAKSGLLQFDSVDCRAAYDVFRTTERGQHADATPSVRVILAALGAATIPTDADLADE